MDFNATSFVDLNLEWASVFELEDLFIFKASVDILNTEILEFANWAMTIKPIFQSVV